MTIRYPDRPSARDQDIINAIGSYVRQHREHGERFSVSHPFHGEGATVWYVLDPEGDPVDSANDRNQAVRLCNAVRALYGAAPIEEGGAPCS